MAVAMDSVWAIDLGSNSLKALHLRLAGNAVQVIGFDNIQHGKILTGSSVKTTERDELTAISLRQFVKRNNISTGEIVVSVPSQNSFARFVSLPPVESKRIPEIVKFEAAQQIPFDINDVQWDWQLMTDVDSDQKKVGIFAIKNEAVESALEHFNREDMQVSYVQMVPMALYNYLVYDRPDLVGSDNRATIILNIGAENTDLVVCTKSAVWQRCILIGGNNFTKAIADTFKLNFEKAEKLKRTAPVSKYARQIFQAMKPVFTDLVSETQRSLGFYTSSNPNTKFTKVIALGGGTRLRGLLKYLQQTLQVPVERPDSFKRLAMGPGVSTAKFLENISDFGIVYGLALQGLGLAKIESNLLPRSIARSKAWASKGKYFIAAASILLLVSLMCLARTSLDKINYAGNSDIRRKIGNTIVAVEDAARKLQNEQGKSSTYQAKIKKHFNPFQYREVLPLLQETIISALPNAKNNPEQRRLYQAFANGDIESVLEIPRKERRQLFVTSMSVFFADDLETAKFGSTAMMRKRGAMMGEGADEYSDYEYELMMEEMMMGRMGPESPYSRYSMPGGEVEQKDSGFVVTIAGYSPYRNIGELIDPVGIEDEPEKWGFVTRLMHIDKNSPFELYKKSEFEHFKFEKGPVDWDEPMPAGIGIAEVRATKQGQAVQIQQREQILVDPMTGEVISKIPELDEHGKPRLDPRKGQLIYETNDHWFVLNIKLIWKDAPQQQAGQQAQGLSGSYQSRSKGSAATGAGTSGRSSGRI
jgi:type IV pilus assembly protein PilM